MRNLHIGDLFYLRGYLYVVKSAPNEGLAICMVVRDESGIYTWIGDKHIGETRNINLTEPDIVPMCTILTTNCPNCKL